jgi:hypothetical protein
LATEQCRTSQTNDPDGSGLHELFTGKDFDIANAGFDRMDVQVMFPESTAFDSMFSREKQGSEVKQAADDLDDVSVIAAGNFPTTAARACGVAESAFMNWMRLGREGKDPEYAEFVEQVKAAENQAEASAVGRINAAMQDPKLWTAAAWFLERKFPDRWGMTGIDVKSGA